MDRETVTCLHLIHGFRCQLCVSALYNNNIVAFVQKHNVFKMIQTGLECRIVAVA